MDLMSLVYSASTGAIVGAGYGFALFANAKDKNNDEVFEWKKLGQTVLVAAVIGGGLAVFGKPVTPETLQENGMFELGLTILGNVAASAWMRRRKK